MTRQDAIALIDRLKTNPMQPPLSRNKSWLLVYADPAGDLHFYDNKQNLQDVFNRILAKHPDYILLDIQAYTDENAAAGNAKVLRDAVANVAHYTRIAREALRPAS